MTSVLPDPRCGRFHNLELRQCFNLQEIVIRGTLIFLKTILPTYAVYEEE